MIKVIRNNLEKIYYILGEGLAKGGALLLFPFFTNYLSKLDFGKLSLYWACIPFLAVFMDFSQRSYIKRIYIEKSNEIRASYLTVSSFSFLMFVLMLGFYLLAFFLDLHLIDENFDFFLLITAFLFTLVEIHLSLLQIRGAALSYGIIYVLKTLLPYVLTVLMFVVLKQNGVYIYPVFQIGVLLLIVLILILRKFSFSDVQLLLKSFNRIIGKSFRFGAPLILGTLSATGLNVADRIIISFSEGDKDVANYTVAYTIASILVAFFMATNKWWQRFILVNLKENNIDKIRSTMWKYIIVVFSIALAVFLLRKYMILLFSNEEYLNVIEIIPTLLLGMLFYFLYTLFLNIPFYHNNTFHVILPAFIAFLFNTILNIILIPTMGYEVAALTTMISYFLEFLIIYLICIKIYRIDLFFGRTLKT